MSKINLIILFLSLTSFILAEVKWINFDYSTLSAEYVHDKSTKERQVAFDFKDYIPYYIKVSVIPEEGTPTPLLCFSATDSTCSSERQALAKNTDGKPAVLFVRREQINGERDELYILVTCQDSNCGYTLKAISVQAAEIEPNTVYSYYVSSGNREMRFEVKGEVEEGSCLTIGIEGSSTAQLSIDDVSKPIKDLGTGKIITYPIQTQNGTISSFSVRGANVGDFITISVHPVINNQVQDNLLYPNGPVIMGMLDETEAYMREECFPMSILTSEKFSFTNKYYLTGRIHSKYALFWLADENGNFMEETEQEISDGLLSVLIENSGKKRSVCFEFSYESSVKMDYVAYSISILEPTKLESFYNFYPPQKIGQTYRRMIPRGSYAVYHGGKIDTSDKRYNYNIYNRKGVAEMYINKCTTFPNCLYPAEPSNSMTKIKRIGKQAIWDTTVEKTGTSDPISSSKYVMIIYCLDEDNEGKGYCEVDSSIFIAGQETVLVENEKFSKFVLKGDKGIIKADFKGGVKLQRVTIDIMVFSGDVNFNVKNNALKNGKLSDEEIELNFYKYYLSNKIFFHFNFAQLALDELTIEYTAELNSFFSVQYGINSINLIQLEENVPSGESYLVQIDPTTTEKYKTIYLENYRIAKEQPFLANFFALNCEFQVTRGENEISFFDGYAQEILTKDTIGYKEVSYPYKIKILEQDLSNYNHKMCMLYVAGYESKDKEYETEIVIAENINQQVIFEENFKSVRFLYPQADPEKDLALYINVIDSAYYSVKVYINNDIEPFKQYTVTRTQINYIGGTEITNHCEKDTLCNIIVEVTLTGSLLIKYKTDPMIEITIRQIKNTPTYLQKSIAKKDFTCGDKLYYLYTDIGKNEIGEVSINFLRDFGYVWGKVVRKDQTFTDPEANWRGVYRMPSEEWEDSLPFNGYTKKFEVGLEQTQDCIEGCYLLLSIQVSQIGEYVRDNKFYPFTIISRITPNNHAYTDIPKVVIQTDEYIVGNVDLSENERIYQFYEIWLPHDTYNVEFDWQSSVAGLYINVGGTRPTTKNADFKLLPPGSDSLFYLNKFDILEKAKARKIKIPNENSLQDLNLVIGIWTDKTDSIDTELFSLRVHLQNDDYEIDITEINTDQKYLCSPRYLTDDQYRCLFMVTYDEEDVELGMPLIVHASSLNQSAITYTYANFIERKIYDEFDQQALIKNTPTQQTSTYSTFRSNTDYIYTTLSSADKKYYLFVNVISDRDDNIMIITSLPMYNVISSSDYEFYPNPSSEQLLSVSVDQLRLKFFTTSSLIVNIVTLGGEADVHWAKDQSMVYNLRGNGDRLALTSGEKLDQIIITKRKTSNSQFTAPNDPGFVFYISYYVRNAENNFDEVKYGKSIEIGYRQSDLPIYLYSKVGAYFSDLNAAVTFRDSDIDTKGEYVTSPFLVKAALAKESTIYRAKQNPELSPTLGKSVFGIYDFALKTALVFLSHEIIQSFNIKVEDNPTLYLSLEKSPMYETKVFTKFNIETQFSKVNDGVIPVEKTYNYGKYSGYYTNYYALKNDKDKTFMKIEIAFNSNYLAFSVNLIISRNNATDLIEKVEEGRGKIFLTLRTPINREFIYLNIYKKNYRQPNDFALNNYVFKYINYEKEDEFIDYKILDNNNELKYEETKDGNDTVIKCTFNKIEVDNANITYFFKVVDNSTHFYGEEYETIAVMESPYYTVYERNPVDNNGKITLTAKGDLSNWVYLQIIAQIQQDTILEYVAYKGVKYLRPPPKENNKEKEEEGKESQNQENLNSSTGSTVFIIIVIILVVLIIGLFVVVFIFHQRNKSLVNQVKHVSFQQNAQNNVGGADPNLLLQKNQSTQ